MIRKKKKRFYCIPLIVSLISCITLSPATVHAAPETPGNAEGWTKEEEDYLKDIPFYYDEDMEKVYDLETFPERYYGIAPAIAGADDIALLAIVAIGCVLGAFGIQMASEDIGTFLVGSFKPWLEKKHPDKMSDFEIFLTGGAIALSEWVPLLGEFLNGEEVSVKDTGIEYNPNLYADEPYFSDWSRSEYTFLIRHSLPETSSTTFYDYVCPCSHKVVGLYLVGDEYIRYAYVDEQGVFRSDAHPERFYNIYDLDGYWRYEKSRHGASTVSAITMDEVYQCKDFLVFKNKEALQSYYHYGTTGGIVNQSVGIQTTATKLLSHNLKFHESHIYAEEISLPADEASLRSVASSLDSAKTYEEMMEVVDKYWQTSPKKVELTDAACYSNLQYIIRVLSRYAGTAITDDQIDAFISHFYQTNTDGTSALQEKQAGEIVRQFVVINGGNKEPEDDKNKNKYVIVKRLAAGLGLFLVSAGLVSDAPVFEGGQTIENIELVGSPSELPDPGSTPDKPSSPTVDLSGILDFLKQILEILKAWANPLSLMDTLREKLSLETLFGSIITAINKLPGLLSGELALPALLSDLAASLLSPLDGLTEPIAKILLVLNSIQDALPSPSAIAQAVNDAVIGEDDGSYQLDSAISDKFPFCIPFDLVNSFRVLSAEPIEPVFEIPLIIDHENFSFEDSIEIDLTRFDDLLPLIRFFVLLFYMAGLILATRNLIKG